MTKITVNDHGPLRIEGPVTLCDATGKEFGLGGRTVVSLCRCGLAANKPFCDGSHNVIEFAATGEPATRTSEPLAIRGGEIEVRPTDNGPLQLTGNIEICAGTGRTVDRVTGARLCRCGGSSTKPFCDGTHAKIGFRSDI